MAPSTKRLLRRRILDSSIQKRGDRRRGWMMLTVFLVGLALSWLGFEAVNQRTRSSNRLKFEQEAGRIASDLETSFSLSLEHLRSIPPFFEASEEVSRHEFHQFVTPALKRNKSLYISALLVRVAESEIVAIEAAARKEGFQDYSVHGVDEAGNSAPLSKRDSYFPIYFDEPLVSRVMGADIGTHPSQAKYVQSACGTDEPVVTPPLSLIEDSDDVLSVMAFLRVKDATLKHFERPMQTQDNGSPKHPPGSSDTHCDGIAVVILKVRPMVEVSMGSDRLGEFEILLEDLDADPTRHLVYKNFPGDLQSIHRSGWQVAQREVRFADQTWTLSLAPAVGSAYAPSPTPYWILAVGGLLSLLAVYSVSVTMAIGGLRKQVDQARQLGQYRLGEKLGEGGMGSVFEASHEMLARPAAIKLIRSDGNNSAQRWQSRFEREAQATAGLQSPHTVSVYDFGKTDDGTFTT